MLDHLPFQNKAALPLPGTEVPLECPPGALDHQMVAVSRAQLQPSLSYLDLVAVIHTFVTSLYRNMHYMGLPLKTVPPKIN